MTEQAATPREGFTSPAPVPAGRRATGDISLPRWDRACYGVVLAGTAAFALAVVAAPWLATHGHPVAAHALYAGFKPACHQLPERSLWIFGAPLAVCVRCAGIYAGALLGVAAYPLFGALRRPAPRRLWLALAAVPVTVDFALGWLGIWHNTFTSRALTGLLLGSVAAFYVLPGLVEATADVRSRLSARGAGDGSD